MDTDLVFILGVLMVLFSIPAAMSAYSDGRLPIAPAATVVIACAMMLYAHWAHPGGYALGDIPEVFFTVIGRYLP